jgi:signal transduction histidine kinase
VPGADPLLGLVHGDRARLQQIVWNPLTNAIKVSEEGGAVGIRLRSHHDVLEVKHLSRR